MIFNWFLRLFDKGLLGGQRSSKWPEVRKQFLKENPLCVVCGRNGKLLKSNEIHHCMPFHLDKSLELSPENLITLCREHHLFVGHLMSWSSFNKDVRENAGTWLLKIQNRP